MPEGLRAAGHQSIRREQIGAASTIMIMLLLMMMIVKILSLKSFRRRSST